MRFRREGLDAGGMRKRERERRRLEVSEQRLRGRYWDPAGIANARICHSLVGCGQNYTCFEIYARVTSFSSSFLSLCLFLLSYVHTYLHRPPPPFLFPFFSDSCLILVRCFILHLPVSHPTVVSSRPLWLALRGLLHFIPTTTTTITITTTAINSR